METSAGFLAPETLKTSTVGTKTAKPVKRCALELQDELLVGFRGLLHCLQCLRLS